MCFDTRFLCSRLLMTIILISHSLDIHIQEKAHLEQYIFHRVPYLERRDVKSVMSMKPVMTVLSLIHSSCQVDVQGDGHC